MRTKLFTILVLLGIIPQYAFSDKIFINYQENKFAKKKQHPTEQQLSSIKKSSQLNKLQTRDDSFNKLLIILIGFQEEIVDDPLTTGNGQFQMIPPDDYPIQLAKPPHNLEYFDKMAEAMHYYYGAASLGTYNLQWDIYPKNKSCYTLSQPMSYYNNPEASNEQFVAKMEEYFKESFETADAESPEIDFSEYGHYMIIHAGSDWQHDVANDTPSDIPSFFIRVGDGKEAIVDNGSYTIDYACNVPETIVQDVSEYTIGETTQVSGYGGLNGVMFHEFGHSLGLVDLYAVNSFYPMVGSFDIMDSGGSVEVGMPGPNGEKIYSVEGLIPALPGAFSRVLMFEDNFRQAGILKDIESLENLQDISISCAEKRYSNINAPYIYKLQISPTEYILIENRNVDPDGDGGTAVYSALDSRIALYPTAYADDTNTPTFEYDYLLPSFISPEGDAVGGGLLVWKVNEDVLFNQGSYDSYGNFVSNFANNYINTNFDNRGVEIIEADGIPDIGNIYAYWWQGTAYEYYFRNMPQMESLEGSDYFVGWSEEIHNTQLNSTSTPPLCDNQGFVSSSGLYNISPLRETMKFSYGSPILYNTTSINPNDDILKISPIYNGVTKLADIAIIHQDYVSLFYLNEISKQFDYLLSVDLPNSLTPEDLIYPVQALNLNNSSSEELVIYSGNELIIIINNQAYSLSLSETMTQQPVYHNGKFYIPLSDSLLEVKFDSQTFEFSSIELDYQVEHLLASSDNLYIFTSDEIINYFDNISSPLPQQIDVKPVLLTIISGEGSRVDDYPIIMTNQAKLYYYMNRKFTLIYDYSSDIPDANSVSELALDRDNQGSVIYFTAGNKLYSNYLDGTRPLGFPRAFPSFEFASRSELLVLDNSYLNDDYKQSYGKTLYLPLDNEKYLAWDNRDKLYPALNLSDTSLERVFSYKPTSESDSLSYFFQAMNYEDSAIIQWNKTKFAPKSIIWEVNHNNINRNLTFIPLSTPIEPEDNSLRAYIFPNPVKNEQATLRIFNLKEEASVKLYTISGKLVYENVISSNNLNHVDTLIDFSSISSGIYIALVDGSSKYKFKFAVSK